MLEDGDSSELVGWIPKALNSPPAFLWWDMNIAIPAIAVLLFGLVSGFLLYAIIGVVCYGLIIKKYSASLPKGFAFNLMYCVGVLPLKGYPPYLQRQHKE
jgi:type IV conjugative transfer system protein TraL